MIKSYRTIAINLLSNVLPFFVTAVVSIFLIPLKISYFGDPVYGLFLLASGLLTFFRKTDFGVSDTLKKETPKLLAGGKKHEFDKLFGGAFIFNLLFGIVFGAVVAAVGLFAVSIYNSVNPGNYGTFLNLSIILAIGFVSSNTLSTFFPVMHGIQKIYLTNIITILVALADIAIFLWVKKTGASIGTYVIINMISLQLPGLFSAFYVVVIEPGIKFTIPRLVELRPYLRFSFDMLKNQIAHLVMFEADRIVLGIFMTPVAITQYFVGQRVFFFVERVFNKFNVVFLPVLSERMTRGDTTFVEKTTYKGSRLLAIIWFPILMVLIANIDNIIGLWIGESYRWLRGFALLFLVPYLLTIPMGILVKVYIARGDVTRYMNIKLVAAALNIVLSVALVQFFGLWGVAIGTFIQMIIFVPLYYRIFFSDLAIPVAAFARNVFLPAIITIVLSAVVPLTMRFIYQPERLLVLAGIVAGEIIVGWLICATIYREDFKFLLTGFRSK